MGANYRKAVEMKPFVEYLKEHYGDRELTGVEIGVYTGANALSMITNLNIQKLYLVDPYIEYSEYDKAELGAVKYQIPLEATYKQALADLTPYKSIQFIRQKSQDAVDKIPEVDFVYVDGNHAYEYVKQDIESYFPKLKQDGVLGGDNFELKSVLHAVGEFTCNNGLVLYTKPYEYYAEWWFKR